MQIENHIGEYIKRRNGKKVGFLLAFKDRYGNVRIGWSLCHKNDKFSRYTAKALAYLRAWEPVEPPPSILADIDKFINKCLIYFKVGEQPCLPEAN